MTQPLYCRGLLACAKICCDLMTNNGITAKWSFHWIWIASKNCYWNGPQTQAVCNVKWCTLIIAQFRTWPLDSWMPLRWLPMLTVRPHPGWLVVWLACCRAFTVHVQRTATMSGSNWDPNILVAPATKAPTALHLGIVFAPPRPESRGVVGNDVPSYTDATNIDAIFDK